MEKKNTYFVDIDGTIFKYRKFETYETSDAEVIESTLEFLNVVKEQGHMIILTNNPAGIGDHSTKDYWDNCTEALKLLSSADERLEILEKYFKPNVQVNG